MSSDTDLESRFQRLKEAVLVKRPILRRILEKHGSKNLYQYAQDYIDVNLNPPIQKRQDEFINAVRKQAEKRFDSDIAKGIAQQLLKHYFVSTADHLGPVCHPFFVNSNLLTAAPCLDCENPHLQYIIVLACSNVSLNNSSFPRGLLFHSSAKGKFDLHRLPFFPANMKSVYNLPAFAADDVEKMKHMVDVKLQNKEIYELEAKVIKELLEEIYNRPEVLHCQTYSEQISKTNLLLWRKFFAPSPRKPPELVYLELESLVTQLLIDNHLSENTVIHHILFDDAYEPYIRGYFDGIFGCFSSLDGYGTYLFWAIPKGKRYSVPLEKDGRFLRSKDGSYEIELTPEHIKRALEEKELIPGLLVDFLVVSLYYGLKCLGGFNQVNYLTLMKNAYIKMNADLGNYRSIEVCARAQTKELCDGLTIAFLADSMENMVLATGLDLILYGTEKTWPQFLEVSKNITVEEALNPLMPEIYKITYLDTEWEKDLISMNDEEIIRLKGLNKKIKPCVNVP